MGNIFGSNKLNFENITWMLMINIPFSIFWQESPTWPRIFSKATSNIHKNVDNHWFQHPQIVPKWCDKPHSNVAGKMSEESLEISFDSWRLKIRWMRTSSHCDGLTWLFPIVISYGGYKCYNHISNGNIFWGDVLYVLPPCLMVKC